MNMTSSTSTVFFSRSTGLRGLDLQRLLCTNKTCIRLEGGKRRRKKTKKAEKVLEICLWVCTVLHRKERREKKNQWMRERKKENNIYLCIDIRLTRNLLHCLSNFVSIGQVVRDVFICSGCKKNLGSSTLKSNKNYYFHLLID